MNRVELLGRWTREKSEELYGVKSWGGGYFRISDKGEMLVNPFWDEDPAAAVSLMDIISGVRDRGLDMPVLLRFENLLDAQISLFKRLF